MKLSHFLLLCACLACHGVASAQNAPGFGLERAGRGMQRDSGQSLDNDRTDRLERRRETLQGGGDQREQLSPEERRQLRRDVNDAGREIYRRPGRPGRF